MVRRRTCRGCGGGGRGKELVQCLACAVPASYEGKSYSAGDGALPAMTDEELRELEDGLARVCPGCYAIAPERCYPGCVDEEMRREAEDHDNDYAEEFDDDE